MQAAKQHIIQQLRKEILLLQRQKRTSGQCLQTGLGELEDAFPDHTFPLGVVHEFISNTHEDAAATNGFIAGLIGPLMEKGRFALWVNSKRTIFPPALYNFGIKPEQIIFIDAYRPKDVLWAIEEGLKCESIAAVVGMLSELSFIESRRLQLAVEQSKVTSFIHRYKPRSENTVACVTRWKIRPVCSETEKIPGVGFARWNVQLLKVRNGRPGSWQIEWSAGTFRHITTEQTLSLIEIQNRKTG